MSPLPLSDRGLPINPIRSWGRLSAPLHEVQPLRDLQSAPRQIAAAGPPGLAHGMGRSYGDVCLNPHGRLWTTRGLDHFISLDRQTGRLVCEAGVLLREIQDLTLPLGWALPVTPGTQLITLGGAIANDIHGKNHHVQGTFGHHVVGLTLARTTGELIECGPGLNAEWFTATVGGMGLTGVILQAEIQLRRVHGPWLESESIPYTQLHEFFSLADESEAAWEHTVSWIDCITPGQNRGIFMRANPASVPTGPLPPVRVRTMPLVPPVSLVNPFTLRPFNAAYYHLNKRRSGRRPVHYRPFFYPLDNLQEWNRLYGPRGFYQYQSVVPREAGEAITREMLGEIRRSGEGSFLAVLKTFGTKPSLGLMSFPMPGVTLALDFPNRGGQTRRLFERLDAIVHAAGGRLYPAKDSAMPRDLFRSGYPRQDEFSTFRDPGIRSGLSQRLLGS